MNKNTKLNTKTFNRETQESLIPFKRFSKKQFQNLLNTPPNKQFNFQNII